MNKKIQKIRDELAEGGIPKLGSFRQGERLAFDAGFNAAWEIAQEREKKFLDLVKMAALDLECNDLDENHCRYEGGEFVQCETHKLINKTLSELVEENEE